MEMPTAIKTMTLLGRVVNATCIIEEGAPSITVVGCHDATDIGIVARCAIHSAGFEVPRARVVVQLDPPFVARSNPQSGFSLAVATAILAESGQIPPVPDDVVVHGELRIDGTMHHQQSDVAIRHVAARQGLRMLDVDDLAGLKDPVIIECDERTTQPYDVDMAADALMRLPTRLARLAAASAVGRHDVMLIGRNTPIARFARAVTALMGPLDDHDVTDVVVSHAAQHLPIPNGRPLRMPHCSASMAAMVGGGRPIALGEVALANHGVLALEDMTHFPQTVLDAVSVAHADGQVRLVRTDGEFVMDTRFVLIASARPCPCGNLGDPAHECTCSPTRIHAWRQRMTEPFAFDIMADVTPDQSMTTPEEARSLAEAARILRDSHARWSDDATSCMTEAAREVLDIGSRNLRLTDEARQSAARVARSFAAIDGCHLADESHVATALSHAPRMWA